MYAAANCLNLKFRSSWSLQKTDQSRRWMAIVTQRKDNTILSWTGVAWWRLEPAKMRLGKVSKGS